MDVFEVFPQLLHENTTALKGRSLRLIALSAMVCDEAAFYFEIGDARMWGQTPQGQISIGVSPAKVRPDAHNEPTRALAHHLRTTWRCEVSQFSAGHAYILDETRQVVVLKEADAALPYLFILTPPQLGGGDEVPDALVQAVYLMPLTRWRNGHRATGLLKIQREALGDFLAPPNWELPTLQAKSWAEFRLQKALPKDAQIRPVLALRGLQHLMQLDDLRLYLMSFSAAKKEAV
ncbi:MAG: hypothetical protein JXA21_29425 [Anaerolineae bacterium]|nr:hypothetical protein [Anaerolineae bacterium]